MKFCLIVLFLLCNFLGISSQNNYQSRNSTYNFNGVAGDFNVNYKGDIKVADDDKSILSITPGGFLEIEKKTFGNSRKLNVYPIADGKIVYEYKEGFGKVDFEPNGRKWMEEILPEVIRSTGIDVEGRVHRIYSKGGINAIINEINSIENDYTASAYYRVLISTENLTESEYKLSVIALSKTVSSDYEKANVLSQVSQFYITSVPLSEAFLTSVSVISSDFEKSRVLKGMDMALLSEEQQSFYLNSVNTINSDFEKSNVIELLLSKMELSDNNLLQAIEVTSEIDSDYEKSGCLMTLLTKCTNDNQFIEIFKKTTLMTTEFDKSNVLKKASEIIKPSSESLDSYFEAINSMSSDFDCSAVLKSVVKNVPKDETLYIKIFDATAGLNSDFEKSAILTLAAAKMPKTEKVKEEYIKAANTISSTYELGLAMKAIHQ